MWAGSTNRGQPKWGFVAGRRRIPGSELRRRLGQTAIRPREGRHRPFRALPCESHEGIVVLVTVLR
jgi:hypothetical protein